MAKVTILEEYCKGCELCVAVCPQKMLTLSNRYNSRGLRVISATRSDGCTGCCNCTTMCPDAAIEITVDK